MGAARVDVELVRRGLARSRGRAAALVAQGAVTVDGRVVGKPSVTVDGAQRLEVVGGPAEQFASRAGFKLDAVLDALAGRPALEVPVHGAWCLDLGASTGGFTDVLLRRGAAHVDAVDVGHDQLVPALRADPRVGVHEGVNARELDPATLAAPPTVVVADLSFISLTLVLPAVAPAVADGAHVLVMVKPQFEVGRERLGSGGVVRDPALHVVAVTDVAACAQDLGLEVRAVVPSPLPGPSGNREFFLVLRAGGARASSDAVRTAVTDAVRWQPVAVPDGERPADPPVVPVEDANVTDATVTVAAGDDDVVRDAHGTSRTTHDDRTEEQ
ncbi:23S rRNA (cytidine1920-2'-O)/16S rRNA (cytidine1409-2'-O)-methyltransferase [Sediminihabitans luteus]|uniref:23S rRNA (Cytidine1920-2'-O)/16S rRNA (Cytidine1409-2'-O)-methyltransferase n=1 Tax=Sediminihabitans luteus TaxID=1138585 RepID=A0A2M9CRC2_9CELL|nr:TlyA family RNA methyltransferase [Sediminihabitans luteus]PJJ74439.1 23S rRNA (cytidine1920-2'-O)/16S rRNA (cytidine1409-2'-O)-methyltransferase [Sediminihabitans luteus]GIJ00194.1 16S/23S rRNA (cytidine-2'-O)-methyltransferase [Sediminihabitans luteus]